MTLHTPTNSQRHKNSPVYTGTKGSGHKQCYVWMPEHPVGNHCRCRCTFKPCRTDGRANPRHNTPMYWHTYQK
jgi:hypothetical protein